MAKCFKKIFHKDAEHISDLIAAAMEIPFTTNEIKSVVRKPKSDKSQGKGEISAKLIEYALDIAYEKIAKTYIT